MDYLRSFAISAAGMAVERMRVEVASLNLANAQTLQSAGEPGYRPLRVVAQAAGFGAQFAEARDLTGLPAAAVEPTGAAPRMVHEPAHPLADARGFVAYPGVDPATEMVTLMGAARSYEANVAALNTARALALKTLEIGRSS